MKLFEFVVPLKIPWHCISWQLGCGYRLSTWVAVSDGLRALFCSMKRILRFSWLSSRNKYDDWKESDDKNKYLIKVKVRVNVTIKVN